MASVVEDATYGSIKTYSELGYARSVLDKIDILFGADLGLWALHNAGLIHRDLEASNLLVCKHIYRNAD